MSDICDRNPQHVRDCEWATVYGDGTHVDMMNAGPDGRFVATCCDVGEIDGPCGLPVCDRNAEKETLA